MLSSKSRGSAICSLMCWRAPAICSSLALPAFAIRCRRSSTFAVLSDGSAVARSSRRPPDIRRLLDRMDIGLSERDVGGKIVVVDDHELVINGMGHAHAQ